MTKQLTSEQKAALWTRYGGSNAYMLSNAAADLRRPGKDMCTVLGMQVRTQDVVDWVENELDRRDDARCN